MFARRADDSLASFAGRLDEIVTKNADKQAKGTVVMLTGVDDVKEQLEKIATDKKLESVPLTVASDGAAGPSAYSLSKDVPFTVVVYDKRKKVTDVIAGELDAANQDKAIEAFARVLGVDAPKGTAGDKKGEEKKPDKKDEANEPH